MIFTLAILISSISTFADDRSVCEKVRTRIYQAVYNEEYNVVKNYLDIGWDANFDCGDGITIIEMLAIYNDISRVQGVSLTGDINDKQEDIVRLLLDNGASPLGGAKPDGWSGEITTPLYRIMKGRKRDYNPETACNKTRLLALLLEYGANPELGEWNSAGGYWLPVNDIISVACGEETMKTYLKSNPRFDNGNSCGNLDPLSYDYSQNLVDNSSNGLRTSKYWVYEYLEENFGMPDFLNDRDNAKKWWNKRCYNIE